MSNNNLQGKTRYRQKQSNMIQNCKERNQGTSEQLKSNSHLPKEIVLLAPMKAL